MQVQSLNWEDLEDFKLELKELKKAEGLVKVDFLGAIPIEVVSVLSLRDLIAKSEVFWKDNFLELECIGETSVFAEYCKGV
mmetsp:Transcript_1548/g.2497  ORF Transcript_1548/g.2497 Transcript_1548/m.2497 type:complete len:81 (-) Transcript_1548:602-844(-)